MLEPRIFQSVTRSITVSYPNPFIFVAWLLFGLVCLHKAASLDGLLRWVLVGFAAVGAGFDFVVTTFTVLRRPELLRSERHALVQGYLEFLTAQDIDDSTRGSAEKVILGLSGSTSRGRGSRPKSIGGQQNHE